MLYSHTISPKQMSAENTRNMSEMMMRFCCWCTSLIPSRRPTRTYARVNNDHSVACRGLDGVKPILQEERKLTMTASPEMPMTTPNSNAGQHS